jgi:hypothetical protein
MKVSDIKKLDEKTQKVIVELLRIGFKPTQIGVYTMYANVHITLPSAFGISVLKKVVNIMPDGSSISSGNNFRSGITIRLPWNLSDDNYKNNKTVFD